MNPYVILRLYYGNAPYIEAMAAFPFALLFFIKSLELCREGWRIWIKYVIAFSLASGILLSSHFGITFLVFLFLASYGIGYILIEVRSWDLKALRCHLMVLITAIALCLIINSWWLFPVGFMVVEGNNPVIHSLKEPSAAGGLGWIKQNLIMESKGINPIEVFRTQIFGGKPRFVPEYWGSWIKSPYFDLIGVILFTASLIPVILNPLNRKLIFFTVVHVLSVGGLMGTNSIVGKIWLQLIEVSPLFATLTQFNKAGQLSVFTYAILFGFFIQYILERSVLQRKILKSLETRHVVMGFFILLVSVNAAPLLTGNIDRMLSPYEIPHYYYETDKWLSLQEGSFRVLVLPDTKWLEYYSWFSEYDMVDVTLSMLSRPVIGNRPQWQLDSPHVRLLDNIMNLMRLNETEHAGKLLAVMDAKYILFKNDLLENGQYGGILESKHLKEVLAKQKDLVLVKSIGKLDIYENRALKPNMLIYTSRELFELNGPLPKLFNRGWEEGLLSPRSVGIDVNEDVAPLPKSPLFTSIWKPVPFNLQTVNTKENANVVMSYDETDRIKGASTIKVESTANSGQWSEIWLPLPSFNQESQVRGYDTIRFWFKINSDQFSSIQFIVKDYNDGYRIWNGAKYAGPPNAWKLVEISLDSDYIFTKKFDSSSLTFIGIKLLGEQSSSLEYKISAMELGYFVRSNQNIISAEKFSEAPAPMVIWKQIDPTFYEANVDSAAPYLLVFKEAFNPEWKLTIKNSTNREPPHIKVNTYANGWVIDSKGPHTINIEYKPQRYYDIGLIISGIAVVIFTLVLVIVTIRNSLIKPAK